MSDRREFLRQAAAAVAGLDVTRFSLTAQPHVAMPTPRAAALMAAFGLKFPIFNAGMGPVANPELAVEHALTRASATDTVLTVCFQDGWINAPHRVLRNRTTAMWEPAGCPPPGKRPGEGDVLATNIITGATKRRYSTGPPYPDDRGTLDDLALYAGQGVARFARSRQRASWSRDCGRSASGCKKSRSRTEPPPQKD